MAEESSDGVSRARGAKPTDRLPRKLYERELFRLQAELVKVQEWVRVDGRRLVVLFEGRDAAGKGSTIKRVTQFLNPRVARIAALPAPTERERTQWYFQRYISHLPAAGEIVLLIVFGGELTVGDGALHGAEDGRLVGCGGIGRGMQPETEG